MSLLDGKYEIIRQSAPSAGRTLFEATAPDGTLVRIDWFELEPAKEPAFERYRRVLKALKRDGKAAVYDVISRPGAHYVAWERANGSAPAHDESIAAVLEEHGFGGAAADVRRNGRAVRLYGLAWDGEPQAAPEPAPPAERPAAPRPGPLARLPEWGWSTGLAVLMLVASALLLSGGFMRRANDRVVVVPDVLGQEVNVASQSLGRLDLTVRALPRGSTEPAGTVLASDPPAGTALRPGRTVGLTYALPPGELAPTEAPQLVGLRYPAEVLPRLQEAGLELGAVARVHASTPADVVLAQATAAGSAVGAGQAVGILVSAGPSAPTTFLPRLVGLSLEDARYFADVAGLGQEQILEDPVSAPSGAPDEVLGQSLAPFLPVPTADATLRLIVQRGRGQDAPGAGVPNLVGLSEQAARRLAGGAELRVRHVGTAGLPEGVVLQDPPPGAPLDGGVLTVSINAHPVGLRPPAVRVVIEQPAPRCVPYAWSIQPGIPLVTSEVYATPLGGVTTLAQRSSVRGGQVLQGCWRTTFPGPVTFRLALGGAPYGEALLVP